jgi:acyl transferase domain-containing protein
LSCSKLRFTVEKSEAARYRYAWVLRIQQDDAVLHAMHEDVLEPSSSELASALTKLRLQRPRIKLQGSSVVQKNLYRTFPGKVPNLQTMLQTEDQSDATAVLVA